MAKKNLYEDEEYHFYPRETQAEAAKSAQARTLQDQANYWDTVAYNQTKPVGTNPSPLYDALSGMANYWEGQAYNAANPGTKPPPGGGNNGGGSDGVDWSLYPNGRAGEVLQFGDMPAGGFSYGKAPEYIDPYKRQIDALTQQILGRGPFEYDYTTDPSYQQYAAAYGDAGRRAMQDTLGQMAARTGGLASSYANSASQQAYNNYMARLADKVPELRQAAYAMYQDEGNQMRQNLAMLQGLSSTDYGRFQDTLSQWNTDRTYDTGLWRYGVEDERYAAEQALKNAATAASLGDYSRYDALGFDTSRARAKATGSGGSGGVSKSDARNRIEAYLTMGGNINDLPEDLLAAAGYSGAELGVMGDYYAQQGTSGGSYTPTFKSYSDLQKAIEAGDTDSPAFQRDYQALMGTGYEPKFDTPSNIKSDLGLPRSWSDEKLELYLAGQGDIEEYVENGVIKFRWK